MIHNSHAVAGGNGEKVTFLDWASKGVLATSLLPSSDVIEVLSVCFDWCLETGQGEGRIDF